MRLIDADAANVDDIPCFYGTECRLENVEEWLDEQPTIDAEPVRHAEWDNSGRYRFKNGRIAIRCTSCGCALRECEIKKYKYNYCPVCGSKMKGCEQG